VADITDPNSKPSVDRKQIVTQARQLLMQGHLSQAAQMLLPLANQKNPDAEALYLLGVIAQRENRIEDATRIARLSLSAQQHPDTLLLLATCQRESGDLESAIQNCNALLRLNPRNLPAQSLKADALQESGSLEEAESILSSLSKLYKTQAKPVPPVILDIRAKLLLQQHENAEAIKTADAILNRPNLQPPMRKAVLFTKVKACDRIGEFDLAFQSAVEAHKINSPVFDPEQHEANVTQLLANWSPELVADFPESSCDSSIPVFIAGMPRSGTSLLDQIIDAHPLAAGVGELGTVLRFAAEVGSSYDPSKPPNERFGSCDSTRWTEAAWAYVNQIQGEAQPEAIRIVNKAIGNDMITGLIARMFPAAKIIHITRDPRDVATSCFLGAFNSSMYPWTSRLEWTAKAWEQSQRLMDFWKESLSNRILEIRYEDLASKPEDEIPKLLEFLGLEHDDRCFEFYKSKRRVRTLSHDQVSKPMYTSSIGRHKNYAAHIDPIRFPEYR
jgi:tetratricopeptide (TPR) repeat protein